MTEGDRWRRGSRWDGPAGLGGSGGRRAGGEGLERLARGAAAGDRRALEEFIGVTQGDVWRFCAHLADRARADDLTQETYLRAIPEFAAFPG